MPVYLIRHTKPDVEKGICYGQLDLPLASTYDAEYACVKNAIKYRLTKIFHSPLLRAATLARDLAQDFGCDCERDSRLKELNFGAWEGQKWLDIPREEIDPWGEDFVNRAPPGGESFQTLANRTQEFWQSRIVGHEHEIIGVVCHGGPIRALLASALNTPLKSAFAYRLNYGAVCLLTGSKDQWVLEESAIP